MIILLWRIECIQIEQESRREMVDGDIGDSAGDVLVVAVDDERRL